jgi:hypothetical protein
MRRLAIAAAMVALGSLASAADKPAALAQCGDCHMVFPAQMLPQRSWTAILAGLADHFGENADIAAKDKAEILAYLIAHAADSAGATVRDRHYLSALSSDETPLRITTTAWWRQMHADYSFEATKHPEVKSPADCQGCHANGFD